MPPSAAACVPLARVALACQVNRSNFGLTLDIGHMLMAGENPAQSVALVGSAGKLFGVQVSCNGRPPSAGSGRA